MADSVILNASGVPEGQYSIKFLQGMVTRMGVGYHRYGSIDFHRADWLKTAEERVKKYQETGNTEWLMDAANFLMVEFMSPKHPDAHFRATEHSESPGYITPEGHRRTSTPEKPQTSYRREGD